MKNPFFHNDLVYFFQIAGYALVIYILWLYINLVSTIHNYEIKLLFIVMLLVISDLALSALKKYAMEKRWEYITNYKKNIDATPHNNLSALHILNILLCLVIAIGITKVLIVMMLPSFNEAFIETLLISMLGLYSLYYFTETIAGIKQTKQDTTIELEPENWYHSDSVNMDIAYSGTLKIIQKLIKSMRR